MAGRFGKYGEVKRKARLRRAKLNLRRFDRRGRRCWRMDKPRPGSQPQKYSDPPASGSNQGA